MIRTRAGDIVGTLAEPERIYRRGDMRGVTGYCIAQIYKLIRDGQFPKPIKLGPNSVGWKASDVARWQASREAATLQEAA